MHRRRGFCEFQLVFDTATDIMPLQPDGLFQEVCFLSFSAAGDVHESVCCTGGLSAGSGGFSPMSRLGVGWLCICLAFWTGCWRPNRVENDFSGTLDAWRNAVIHNQPRRAYALLDAQTRQQMPYARFEREWKENRAEMLHEARHLTIQNARMTATIQLGKNENATLVATKPGRWRVEDAPGIRPSGTDPAAVMRAMAAALKRRDWPMYLSLLTPEYRHAVEEDFDLKIKTLEKASENQAAPASGNMMRIPLDSSGMLVLVLRRINGVWRVDGFETTRGGKTK